MAHVGERGDGAFGAPQRHERVGGPRFFRPMPIKKQPPTNAQGAYHSRICRTCDGIGRVTRIVRAGLVEVVTCTRCKGKGGW